MPAVLGCPLCQWLGSSVVVRGGDMADQVRSRIQVSEKRAPCPGRLETSTSLCLCV